MIGYELIKNPLFKQYDYVILHALPVNNKISAVAA